MSILENIVDFFNSILWGKNILVVLLISSGIFFTIKTNFVQIRFLKHMILLLSDKSNNDSENLSPFQAFCISTATRVGAGNLAGVVSAISIGGAGSIFWMWVVAFLGSATAFVETTLAMIFREKDKSGHFYGGPCFFLKNGLGKKSWGIAFVVTGIICWAGVLQVVSNSVTESFNVAFSISPIVISILLTLLAAIVIFGKTDKTAKVLDKVVPIMAILYLAIVFFIILKNITLLPQVFSQIFSEAFGVRQGVGGTIGAIIMQGVKRGLFSNEAGTGSAPCAAASANVSHPVQQGLIQSLGVFVDTFVICTATALVMLLTKSSVIEGLSGMELLQKSFNYHLGSTFGEIFVAIILFLFCFSTLLGICFYGKVNVKFLTDKDFGQTLFKIFALSMIFFGGIQQNIFMWNLADLGLALMTIINMSGVLPLSKFAFDSLKDYQKRFKVVEA
ncbi:alanine:cation symporter family protein [Cetobacterium somerae]|uniref:alanine/glycine:cation symporter family protein n=1 Tax=Cetobacterium sp. NK01 TaxID=2993530 RepID=UPI002117265A|nr:alanine/glycine:cation symporter family protein [Cetobacterium sp. NK01]MCQ8211762.1 alanine:cation symporter family protein [Cetobacterium sp. NK01]